MLAVPHGVPTTSPPRRVLLAVAGEKFSLGQHAGAVRHLLDALCAELALLHMKENANQTKNAAVALAMVQRPGLTAGRSVGVAYAKSTACCHLSDAGPPLL